MPQKYKYTKEILEKTVRESFSVREVLQKIGVRVISGGMHAHITKKIHTYRIDTSHFFGQGNNRGNHHKGGSLKLQPDQILILSTRSLKTKPHLLRRALIERGREYKCYICGFDGDKHYWQGKPLLLQIEHKDGNSINNQENNLEFMCPNCHSQTATYCKRK